MEGKLTPPRDTSPDAREASLNVFSSSLLLSSLELSDTQSLLALNTSPPRNRLNVFAVLTRCRW